MPTYSIIIPTFNAQDTLSRCLNSVINQSFQDYEIIIVDGNSKDSTVDILISYASKLANLKWISEKDNGIYDAMNKGIKLAEGDWLVFLGSDDYLYNEDVLTQVYPYLNNKDEFIYGDVFFERYGTQYDGLFSVEKLLTNNICHQSIFYNKTIFKKLGGYTLKYKIHSDYHFNLSIWLNGSIKCLYVPIIIAFFSNGGASDKIISDSNFEQDYPTLIINLILNGNWFFFKKSYLLSIAFRKIIYRYSFKYFISLLQKNDFKLTFIISGLVILPFSTILSQLKKN